MFKKIFASVLVLLFSLPISAHHGWRSYPVDYNFTATVTEIVHRMPHAYIYAEDEQGTVWHLFLAPSERNERFGYDGSSIPVGVPIQLIGQHERGGTEGKVHFANSLDGENYYTYYYDNGSSSWDRRR